MIYGTAKIPIIAAALLWLSVAWAQQTSFDWLIVPGERVGPITQSTSDAILAVIFGSENVAPVDVNLGEGFSAPGTVVYPDDASRRLEIVWTDSSRTIPREIRLAGNSSIWRTAEGISLGTTLKDIERLNGFPFNLVGFAFDYSGTITDCGRGRLTILGCADATGRIQDRKIGLRLKPSVEKQAQTEYQQLLGDSVFSSGHPSMQILNPTVYQMLVFL